MSSGAKNIYKNSWYRVCKLECKKTAYTLYALSQLLILTGMICEIILSRQSIKTEKKKNVSR